jgi:hypothetical protein
MDLLLRVMSVGYCGRVSSSYWSCVRVFIVKGYEYTDVVEVDGNIVEVTQTLLC